MSYQTIFLDDGKRKIDYALVYDKRVMADPAKARVITTYINNIAQSGLVAEVETGIVLYNLFCVKIHAPNSVLDKYATQFRIEISKNNPFYKIPHKIPFKWMETILTTPNVNHPLNERAPATLSGKPPVDYTYAERIYIVYKILCLIKYDNGTADVGFEWLVSSKFFKSAFPLHDSSDKWTKDGPLSDRQLLARFWASFRYIYAEQPLNAIERYFGPEVAFYFAWLGFYIRMLVPAASLGLLCVLGGMLFYLYEGVSYLDKEVCQSTLLLCPPCPSHEWCSFPPLKSHCQMMKFSYFFVENPITVTYSVIMCFWGVLFMVFWKRKEAMLRLRWNLNDITTPSDIRVDFVRTAPMNRVSSLTGDIEFFFTAGQKCIRKLLSHTILILMLLCYIGTVIIMIYFRLSITYYNTQTDSKVLKGGIAWFESIICAVITCTIMMFFDSFKARLCKWITELEKPRTRAEFDKLYTIKISILSFGNIFFPVVYLAFFKGKFYTHPGDPTQWTFVGLFKADICKMHGCLVDLSVQLGVIMLTKNIMRMISEFMKPFLHVFATHLKSFNRISVGSCTRWEEDHMLFPAPTGLLYGEYIQMVIQYGFMTFFLVSLPIAPVLALINNVVELRLDAIRILKGYRRILPKKVTGIEEWNVVMQITTVLGAISNPLLIAFGSDLIPRYIYLHNNNNDITGYINSTLSEFVVKDYAGFQRSKPEKICFYPANRYPPWHPDRYELTSDYWFQFGLKAVFFIILENICLLLSLFLGYIIPQIPPKVRLKLERDQYLLQEARLGRARPTS